MKKQADSARGKVPVVFFPKKAKPLPPRGESATSDRRVTQTIPEFHPDAEFDAHKRQSEEPITQELSAGGEPDPSRAQKQRPTPPFPPAGASDGAASSSKSAKTPVPKTRPRHKKGRSKTYSGEATDPLLPATPRPDEAQETGSISGEERDARSLLASLPPKPTPQQLAELSLYGHHLFEAGKLEDARDIFERLVEAESEDAFPYTMLGTIYLALGDQDRALALFEAALQMDKNDIAALVYRGEIRLNRGKVKHAVADLNRAIEMGLGDDPFVDRAKRLLQMARSALATYRKS